MFKLFRRTGGATSELGKSFRSLNVMEAFNKLKDEDELNALEEISEKVVDHIRPAINEYNYLTTNTRVDINSVRRSLSAFEKELDLLIKMTEEYIDESEIIRDLYRTSLAYYAIRTVFEMKRRTVIPELSNAKMHVYDYVSEYISRNKGKEIQAPTELREKFLDLDTYSSDIETKVKLMDKALNNYDLKTIYRLFKEVSVRADIVKSTYDNLELRDLGYDVDANIHFALALIAEELEGVAESESHFTGMKNKIK